MLTVRLTAYTSKVVALHNTLETFTLRCTYYIHEFAFLKKRRINYVAQIEGNSFNIKLSYFLLGSSVSFLVVTSFRFRYSLQLFVAVANLHCSVAVILNRLHLSNYTRACLNKRYRCVFTICCEEACHSDFFTDNSRHSTFV